MRFLFALMALLGFTSPAHATDYLVPYAGYFDITQSDDAAVQVGMEYRGPYIYHTIRPGVGINVTDDSAVYGYGGFFWDLYLTDNIIFTPNIVAGAFSHGNGKHLGHGLEFRSGLELSYEFYQKSRIGIAFNHISNASIGDRNPGAETLLINYHHPLGIFE